MKEIAEFRVVEDYAREFLAASDGKLLSGIARRVRAEVGTPEYDRIGELERRVLQREGLHFFLGWTMTRRYTEEELQNAELLLLRISRAFEPAGAECGTVYDSAACCPICGSGGTQQSDLSIKVRSIPRRVDIARTIADEIVISRTFAEALTEAGKGGYELRPVLDCTKTKRSDGGADPSWRQLVVTPNVEMSSKTRTGNNPFDVDPANEYRCKLGHIAGLSLLSELYIERASWDGSDVVATRQLIGVNRGLLRAFPAVAISQQLYRSLLNEGCKGFTVEIVHLVG